MYNIYTLGITTDYNLLATMLPDPRINAHFYLHHVVYLDPAE